MPRLRDIATALEAWAPPGAAQSYDNVGLQVGDPEREVRRALIALDMTPAVLEEARLEGADLIITHHPLLFHPLKQITPQTFVSNLAFRLAQTDIALYAIHTNLDAAPGGVSFALAEQLGLTGVEFLDLLPEHQLEAPDRPMGLGAIGQVRQPVPLVSFLKHVAECLQTPALRYVGDPEQVIRTVAVCGGAGGSFIEQAIKARADVYITADVTYHVFFNVLRVDGTVSMALIDAGHYETEAITESLLVDWLSPKFPDVDWKQTRNRTSPVQTYVFK